MRRRKCNLPPSVQGPDCNVLAHAVMDEALARLDGPPLEMTSDEERREMFGLLAEAAESVGIPVVRTV